METSYDVKVWKIDVYNGARTTSYRVRWVVAGRRWHEFAACRPLGWPCARAWP